MSLFFACLLWQSIICGIGNSSPQTSLQCLSTINMILSDEDKILIKSWYLKVYTVKKFPQSATDFVLLIVRRSDRKSDREHLFVHKANKVSGRLRLLLKQKLSALQASSAAHVCQLLCMAPLETFQMQVLTNNLGHIH